MYKSTIYRKKVFFIFFTRLPHSAKRRVGRGWEGPVVARGDGVDARDLLPVGLDLAGLLGAR